MTKKMKSLFKVLAIVLSVVLTVNLAAPAGTTRVYAASAQSNTDLLVASATSSTGDLQIEDGVLQGYIGEEGITTLKIPKNVTDISENVLNIETLQKFEVEAGNTWYFAVDGVLFKRQSSATDVALVRMPRSSTITDYVMPDNQYITTIEENAFRECKGLTSVKVAKGVRSIRDYAFYNCENLKNVDMGLDVREVGYGIFCQCYNIDTMTLSSSLVDVTTDSGMLSNAKIKTIIFPQTTAYVPEDLFQHGAVTAFQVAAGNQEYMSKDGVLFNGDGTVLLSYPAGRTDTSYAIPEGTVEIGNRAFFGRKQLEQVTMPDSLTTIGESAFEHCTALKEMVLGKNVSSMPSYALYASGITSLTLSEKLTENEDYYAAVSNCSQLTTLYVPANARYVPNEIAKQSTLTAIEVAEGNGRYFSANGVLYEVDEEGTVTLHTYPKSREGASYTILDNTKIIGKEAFYGVKQLEEIIMPDSVEVLADSSLERTEGLKELVLGKNVTTLEYDSLYGSGIKSLTLSEKLTPDTVDGNCVGSCQNLTTLYVPAAAAFVPDNIAKQVTLTAIEAAEGNNRYFSHEGVLYEINEEGRQVLHTYPRMKDATSYAIVEGTQEIGQEAFYNVKQLQQLTMPDSVEILRHSSLERTEGLKELVLGKNVTTLEDDSLWGSGITSLTLSPKLTKDTVNGNSVSNCKQLTTLYVPADAEYVPMAIYNHSTLQNIYVVDEAGNKNITGTNYASVDGILFSADGTSLYRIPAAKSMTEYIIPEQVTRIEDYAVRDQQFLTSITLLKGVQYIGYYGVAAGDQLQTIMAMGCNPETIHTDALYAHRDVVIMCDKGSTIYEHATSHRLLCMTGSNMITANILKLLTGDIEAKPDKLSNYEVRVYLGENGGNEEYEYPAYAAGEYILLPEGREAYNGETIDNYDTVTIQLISRSKECEDSFTVAKLDENKCATVVLTAAQKGYVTGKFVSLEPTNAAIYDAEGNYIDTLDGENGVYTSNYLPEGDYTIVALQGKVRNWFQNTLDAYDNMGLADGSDYSKTPIHLTNGKILTKDLILDKESVYVSQWINESQTSYRLENQQLTAASLMNFKLSYALQEKFKDYELSNLEVVITIPAGFEVYENSLYINDAQQQFNWSTPTHARFEEKEITIWELGNSGEIMFSASPTSYGSIVSSVTLRFDYEGVHYEELIGSISTEMDYITMSVPENTEVGQVLVQGVTVPGGRVTIYDRTTAIATSTAYESGHWDAMLNLTEGFSPLHILRAEAEVDGKTVTTPEYEVIWAANQTKISEAYMYVLSKKYVIEPDGTSNPSVITWAPGVDYTFHLKIEHDENVESVYATTEKDGETFVIFGEKNADGYWVIKGNFANATWGEIYDWADEVGWFLGADAREYIFSDAGDTSCSPIDKATGSVIRISYGDTTYGASNLTYGQAEYDAFDLEYYEGEDSYEAIYTGSVMAPSAGGTTYQINLMMQLYRAYWLSNPPAMIDIGVKLKPVSTTFDNELADYYNNMDAATAQELMDTLPDMWKNATAQLVTDNRDAQGYGNLAFDINLDNEENTTLSYNITTQHNVQMSMAELDADTSYVKTTDENGRIIYTKYHYEETPSSGTGVSAKGGSTDQYEFVNLAAQSNEAGQVMNLTSKGGSSEGGDVSFTMGSTTIVFNEFDQGAADVVLTEIKGAGLGKISNAAGNAWGFYGMIKDTIDIGGNVASVWGARWDIMNSGLPESTMNQQLQQIDNLIVGTMIASGLQYAMIVVTGTMMITGSVPFMVGLAIAGISYLTKTYINQVIQMNLKFILGLEPRWAIDPSGFVYEAVEDDRIEGATATVYYEDPETGEAVVWNAEEYKQINPQTTDEEGIYAWDVPAGLWKVVVEKEGYEIAESEWMEVPPARTGVKIGVVSLEKPEVKSVHLYESSAVVTFTQYMNVNAMTADLFEMDASAAISEITPMLAKPSVENEGELLAKMFRIHYTATDVPTSLTVFSEVQNYAGNNMERTYTADKLVLEKEVTALQGEEALKLVNGDTYQYQIKVIPADAAKTAQIAIERTHGYGVEIMNISEPNADGVITLSLKAALPMETHIDFTVDGTEVIKQLVISVSMTAEDNDLNSAKGDTSAEVSGQPGDEKSDGKVNVSGGLPIIPIACGAAAVLAVVAALLVFKKKKK